MGLVPSSSAEQWTPNGWPSVNRESLTRLQKIVEADEWLSDANRTQTTEALQHLSDAIRAKFMKTSYILPLVDRAVAVDGGMRLFPTLAMDTATGRLVCRQPNLQSMPTNNDPFELRKAFRARPGNVIISCDYSQLELRIIADHANCSSMMEKLQGGGDFHSEVASAMFDEIYQWRRANPDGSVKEKFPHERQIAKTLNFGIAYGISAYRIAYELDMSYDEATSTRSRWYADKPEITDWKKTIHEYVDVEGKVPSLLGRNRCLPLAKSFRHGSKCKRAAVNHCVQGSAADICMSAMIRIHESTRLRELGFSMILQIHDEILLEGPESSSKEALVIIKTCMEKPFETNYSLRVPLIVDGAAADSWHSAKKGG